MTYIIYVEFIETSVFTRQITQLLTDAEYEQLQRVLLLYPVAGDLIKHSGGLRKLRWRAKGKGKRGGIRVIYYFMAAREKIYMLVVYSKSEKADLSQREIRNLKLIAEKLT